MQEFAPADQMHVSFLSGSEREWTLHTEGSDKIAQQFNECLAEVRKRFGGEVTN